MMIDKKIMWKIITVTAVALAVAILVTAVGGMAVFFASLGDKEPPVIEAVNGDVVTITRGENFSYRNQVKVTDNSGKECELEWRSELDQNTAGSYKVKYRATDPSGNVEYLTITVKVIEMNVENDELMALVEDFAKSKLGYDRATAQKNGYSKEKIVRDIYNFVRDPLQSSGLEANIEFVDMSNAQSARDAAKANAKNRKGWKTDWKEEAKLTLTMPNMKGDCYSYYSVSKAFFEYFDIPNIGIQRAEDSTQGGTHYWQAVNIGTSTSPKWYYYDSTRIGSHFTSGGKKDKNSCLITEERLLSYRIENPKEGTKNSDFYVINKRNTDFFDADDNGGVFPKIETIELG